jgi:transcriptional regulator with XRE-family HTH domain
MLLHEAFDKTLKYCRISGTELAKLSRVSSSHISQFRNGLFLEGRGSDMTSRSLDELLKAAEQIEPKTRLIFTLYLADRDPDLVLNSSSLLSNIQSMDTAQLSQLLMAIADVLDRAKLNTNNKSEKKKENNYLVNVVNGY